MNHDNQYQDYSYQTYDDMSVREPGLLESIFGIRGARRIKNPFVATVLLLVLGGGLAYSVMSFYGDDAQVNTNVPIVKADAQPFKSAPDDRQGMEITNQDSTIYQPMQNEQMQETGPIENLLANEKPIDDLQRFASEAEDMMKDGEEQASQIHDMTKPRTDKPQDVAAAQAPVTDDEDVRNIVIGNAPAQDVPAPAEDQSASKQPPATINKPGTSPETLAFVRSVLDDQAPRDDVSNIAPAAGNSARPAASIEPGTFYVQVGSVRSESGADSQWTRIQKDFSVLDGVNYRVQEANLGDRGIYYRIQAGPMSKDSANSLCDSIKAQKPGGCLVVN